MKAIKHVLAWTTAVLGLLSAGCQCNSKDLTKAVGDFMDFGEGKTPDPIKTEIKRDYELRAWAEEVFEGRSRARADVEIPTATDPETLEVWLRDACHDSALLRSTSAVRVWAWPGKLQHTGFPYGACTFARDGRGWNGQGVGFEDVRVFLPSEEALGRAGIQPILEEDYLVLLGVDNLLRRKIVKDEAIAQVAERHGISVSSIQATLANAEKLNKVLREKAGPELAAEATRAPAAAPTP